jgi:Ku protein
VDEVTREPVESQDKGRGYEYSKNAYIQVEDEELDAIAVESNHTIEIDKFVPREQIDERYLDSPYYLLPNDQVGQEAFAVIREAMRGKKMVALGRVVLAKRERIIMLQPWGKGLMGATLRYGYEVRDQKEFFDDLPTSRCSQILVRGDDGGRRSGCWPTSRCSQILVRGDDGGRGIGAIDDDDVVPEDLRVIAPICNRSKILQH